MVLYDIELVLSASEWAGSDSNAIIDIEGRKEAVVLPKFKVVGIPFKITGQPDTEKNKSA